MSTSKEKSSKATSRTRAAKRSTPQKPSWTFLTNHSHVLICLWRDPESRLRDVADRVGITERAVQAIVSDLEDAGALKRERAGRRNRYEINPNIPLRHPVESSRTVGALIDMAGDSRS
ncbi:MAG TPA: winged helix-turn-helix domain-containing protein [Tepidisphaeraceae bacterium]